MKTNTKHWASITAGILSIASYAIASPLGSEKYTYDASGNIIEKLIDENVTRISYGSDNRMTKRQVIGQSSETIDHNAAGHPVSEQNASTHQVCSTIYGYEYKVLETQKQGMKANFYYNSDGRLVGKKTDSNLVTYIWDGNVLAAEGSNLFANEAHISGGVPILNTNKDVIITDYLGNTLASGQQQFTSTAYGEGLEAGRFSGKPYVRELEGFVFQHRNYSASELRWFTADPSGFPDGVNNLEYVRSNPLNALDPDGLESLPATGWTQVFDGPASGATHPAYDVMTYLTSGTSQPLYREWDTSPSVVMKQQGISKQLGSGSSANWGVTSAQPSIYYFPSTLWHVFQLGWGGTGDNGATAASSYTHPGDNKARMVRPTKERLTYDCSKTTYGGYTTQIIMNVPIRTYYAINPPQNGQGSIFAVYADSTSYDLYEQ